MGGEGIVQEGDRKWALVCRWVTVPLPRPGAEAREPVGWRAWPSALALLLTNHPSGGMLTPGREGQL